MQSKNKVDNMDIKVSSKNSKPFYKSKLFWLGFLQLSIGIASSLEANIANGIPLTVSGVLTIILRALTSSEIKLL